MNEKDATITKVELQYPLIRKSVSCEVLQQYAEQIIDYCETLDEPLFIEKDGAIRYVLLSKEYHVKCGYNEICPFPTDEEVAEALAKEKPE